MKVNPAAPDLVKYMVVDAMKSLGWTASSSDKDWIFQRRNASGRMETVRISHRNISWDWFVQYDEPFAKIIRDLWEETLPLRYAEIIKKWTF